MVTLCRITRSGEQVCTLMLPYFDASKYQEITWELPDLTTEKSRWIISHPNLVFFIKSVLLQCCSLIWVEGLSSRFLCAHYYTDTDSILTTWGEHRSTWKPGPSEMTSLNCDMQQNNLPLFAGREIILSSTKSKSIVHSTAPAKVIWLFFIPHHVRALPF